MGRPFLAVPAVLVRSKILNNNLGRTYLPPDAITEEWANAANGAPVVVDHPSRRGTPISARDPAVLNSQGAGFVFATHAEDGAVRGEVWLDPSSPDRIPGMDAILAAVHERRPVEVSTGFPVFIEETPGAFNGEKYDKVIRPRGPLDHLAIFHDKVGACSVADGCGLAANHEGECNATNEEKPVDEKTEGRLAQVLDKLTAFLSRADTPEPAVDAPDEPGPAAETTSQEETSMNREQMIAHLAEAGTDREALNKLSDCQLKALVGTEATSSHNQTSDSEAWQRANHWREKYETLEAQTANARESEEKERARLMDDVLYARNRAYDDDEVQAMGIVELRKLHKTMFPETHDYSGRGGPRATNAGGNFGFVRPILGGDNAVLNERKEAN